jgi:menaquinone-9 beta-reductase
VVVGGGPAGAALACLLAAAGQEVLVLEREAAPSDKVCGDFLSIEAQRSVAALGLDLHHLGAAPISALRLVHGDHVAECVLPFAAVGLSRRVLDEALLRLAEDRGATVLRGRRALALHHEDARLSLVTSHGDMATGAVFLATGKHELRGARRAARAPRSVAFKTYFSLTSAQTDALRGHVEVVLFDGGYAGLLLVEDDTANLSLIASARALERAGGGWDGLLRALVSACPHLARRLCGATPRLSRPVAISRLPYGFVHAPHPADPPNLFRLGDQAAVIPSFTGDGVAIALHSSRSAAAAWLSGEPAAAHHRRLRGDIGAQMRRASWLHAACVTAPVQASLVAACALFPDLMGRAAAWTRIPPAAARRIALPF